MEISKKLILNKFTASKVVLFSIEQVDFYFADNM